MNTALVIMAAGIGSRFGGGIKQLTPIGQSGELIIDYSVHDAVAAGFSKVVLIIRRDIEAEFRAAIGDRLEKALSALNVEVRYVYQALDRLPDGFAVPDGRIKPWGTGHAVLCAAEAIDGPFCVINADDYYGKTAYRLIHDELIAEAGKESPAWCMAGFELGHTLSDFGSVTRGLCRVDGDHMLTDVVETRDITRSGDAALADGRLVPLNTPVSMNMWGFQPDVLPLLRARFVDFLSDGAADPLKKEFLLPIFVGQLLRERAARVRLLPTSDQWFGVTYSEDREPVIRSIAALTEAGAYRRDLFSDLCPAERV